MDVHDHGTGVQGNHNWLVFHQCVHLHQQLCSKCKEGKPSHSPQPLYPLFPLLPKEGAETMHFLLHTKKVICAQTIRNAVGLWTCLFEAGVSGYAKLFWKAGRALMLLWHFCEKPAACVPWAGFQHALYIHQSACYTQQTR